MTTTFDSARFTAGIEKLRADVRGIVARYLPIAVDEALSDPDYLAPIEDEVGHGATLDQVLTPLAWDGTTAAIGVVRVYDWLMDPGRVEHCPTCENYAEGGPYRREDLAEQPPQGADLGLAPVHSHSANNPCHCVLVPREPTWAQSGPRALKDIGAAIGADLEASWRSR